MPFRLMLNHRIENRQSLAHTRGQRDLLLFAGGQEAVHRML